MAHQDHESHVQIKEQNISICQLEILANDILTPQGYLHFCSDVGRGVTPCMTLNPKTDHRIPPGIPPGTTQRENERGRTDAQMLRPENSNYLTRFQLFWSHTTGTEWMISQSLNIVEDGLTTCYPNDHFSNT